MGSARSAAAARPPRRRDRPPCRSADRPPAPRRPESARAPSAGKGPAPAQPAPDRPVSAWELGPDRRLAPSAPIIPPPEQPRRTGVASLAFACGAVAKRPPLRRRLPRPIAVERIGDVAQLGERLNRTQEADGSIPFISTKLLMFFIRKSV